MRLFLLFVSIIFGIETPIVIASSKLDDFYASETVAIQKILNETKMLQKSAFNIVYDDDNEKLSKETMRLIRIPKESRTKEQNERIDSNYQMMKKNNEKSDMIVKELGEKFNSLVENYSRLLGKMESANQYCKIEKGANFAIIERLNEISQIFSETQMSNMKIKYLSAFKDGIGDINEDFDIECEDQKLKSFTMLKLINNSFNAIGPLLKTLKNI